MGLHLEIGVLKEAIMLKQSHGVGPDAVGLVS